MDQEEHSICQMTSEELNTEGPCKSNHEVKVQSILIGGKKLNDAECASPTYCFVGCKRQLNVVSSEQIKINFVIVQLH